MPLWCKGCPEQAADQVIVFLDADNALIQEGRPWNPSHSVGTVLHNVVTFARDVAQNNEIIVFKNLFPSHTEQRKRESDETLIRELRAECSSRGITLVHVERRDGQDQVDHSIVGQWYKRAATTDAQVPFILVSEDAGFRGMIHDARQQSRPVFLALPINKFFPRHANDTSGWGWLDDSANLYRAMFYLLAREVPTLSRDFVENFQRHYFAYNAWEKAVMILASEFMRYPQRRFDDEHLLIGTLQLMWREVTGLPRDAHQLVVPYLFHYGILANRGSDSDDKVIVPGAWQHIMRLPPDEG